METANPHGMSRTNDKLPIPRSREGILEVLSQVLTKPFIQKITLDSSGFMHVEWFRAPMDTLIDDIEDESPDAVISRMDLEEADTSGSLRETLADNYTKLRLKGFVPTFILCGSIKVFKKAIDLSDMVFLPKHAVSERSTYLGMQIEETKELNEDIVIICGAYVRDPSLGAVRAGYKILVEHE